jgi:outer membrane immunogenic protein
MPHLLESRKMKNSKNTLVALLAVLAVGTASAQSMSNQGYYGEVGYTALHIKNDNNGFAITPKLARLTVGKELDKNLAVEGTYAFTASKDSGVVGGVTYTGKESFYGAYLKPKIEVAKDVEAFVRIGALHTKYEDEAGSLSKTKVSYGVGVQAQFTKDVYGQVDYMSYYKQDGMTAKGLTVSVGTRF